MLIWNLKELLIQKGIKHPLRWLRDIHISHNVAGKMLINQQKRVDISVINSICTAAWCTPNDLFVWQPDGTEIIEATHPLNTLKAKAINKLSDKLKKLSHAQIAALDKLAEEMGNGEEGG